MMMKDTQWMAVGRTCVRAVAVVVPAVMLYCFVCTVSLAQAPGGGEGKTISGPNTAFTLVLPEGWQSAAYDAVADRPNAVRMLAMLSLPETARNTDNLNFWWDAEGEKIESGLASLHRFQTEDELDAPGLLALMEQGGRLPEGMELSVTRVGKHEAVLGGGPVEDGLYGAVVVIPGGEALYVATIVGPQTEVAPQWGAFTELAGSLDAPDIPEATPQQGLNRPGTHAGQETLGPDGGVYVWVPPGEFMMGSADDDREASPGEKPLHRVRITRGFWLGKHEVTQAQYAAFLNAYAPGDARPEDRAGNDIIGNLKAVRRGDGGFSHWVPYDGNALHPMTYVSWYGAVAYCTYYGLRLPTEAEWEYAARGPEGRKYPWGNTWDGSRLCWRTQWPASGTSPVGSFPAGASWVGALDMAGNVYEWIADWYDRGYYAKSPVDDPPGPATGSRRVLRGGSWSNDLSRHFRCAIRSMHLVPSGRNGRHGFRCARGLEVVGE